MLHLGSKIAVPLLLLGLIAAGYGQTAPLPGKTAVRRATKARSRHLPKPAAAVPEEPPAPPPTPEQLPPVPPQVTYQGGLLTIVAENSMLGDVLDAVRARLGAALDTPSGLPNERVAVRLGPGAPRDVLSELFNGSRYDYILVGSGDDPRVVKNIIVTPNVSRPAPAMAQAPAPQPAPPRQAVAPPPQEVEEEMPAEESEVPEATPQPAPQPQTQVPGQPPQQQQQLFPTTPAMPPDVQSNQPNQPPGTQPQIKTPEQLLEELKRLQKQQNPDQGPRN